MIIQAINCLARRFHAGDDTPSPTGSACRALRTALQQVAYILVFPATTLCCLFLYTAPGSVVKRFS